MAATPHKYSSINYKVPHPKVVNALKQRSYLDNTIQLATPFIKATATIQNPDILGADNKGFTLGMHATSLDVEYQNIFSAQNAPADKRYPLIGYTYGKDGKNQLIYATPPNDNALNINKLFNGGVDLFSTTNQPYIPPPGITKATVTRGKNGLLISADISFAVPTLSQLEMLHRLFLVPGIGMVLEWGQQFASETVNSKDGDYGETGLTPTITIQNVTIPAMREFMFPWHNRDKLDKILKRLAAKTIGIEEIMNCYVYPTQGQYMWMFGRVGNFSTKANSDGSFDCSVKIVGPSEDAWAFSTTRTVIPPGDPAGKPCPGDANSVFSYFSKTTTGTNFKSLLDDVSSGRKLPAWRRHVKRFPKASGRTGEPTSTSTNPNESEKSFADSEDAYFMTWRFFVNVVLNHPDYGVKSVFKKAKVPDDILKRIAIIEPYYNDPGRASPLINAPGPQYIDDPHESFVGFNKYLRSVDPSTMLIINERAAVESKAKFPAQRQERNAPDYFKQTEMSRFFADVGLFEKSTSAMKDPQPQPDDQLDRGFLSAGVWINHKAVVQSMVGAETILRGISNLLDRMNRASNGYWQLALDANEPTAYQCGADGSPGVDNTSYAWTVVDAQFKENSQTAVSEFINKVHVFNKYVRKTPDGKLVGSDVIDCSVDLALPKLLFSQIATMGLVQPKDLQTAGIEPQQAFAQCSNPTVADPNEALREMFAIASIAPSANKNNVSPDLTFPTPTSGSAVQCSESNASAPAQVGGRGGSTARTNAASTATPAAGESANREFPGMESAFRYIELYPEYMMANIRCEANGNRSNAFGASPGALAINTDITLPGIAGLRIGELFWVDRIPSFYKAFGAFQIVSIEDSIDVGGWTTKIGGKFNYLGEAWKQAAAEIIQKGISANAAPSTST